MKSNLAILSSDQKSIDFIKKNKLSSTLNLYANSSRNIEVAQIFAETHNFKKYYGAYEDLIRDKGVDFILNFLPSGIKFEYIYLCLKNNIKVITDYPIVSNSNDLKYYNKLINSKLIDNLFLIDETSVDISGRARTIDEQKGHRSNISYEMNSEDQLKESMKLKEEEKAEEARLRRLKELEEKSFDAYDRVHRRLLGN